MRRTVMVTGAAAGIGRATALRFAAAGYLVGAYDVDEVGLRSLGDELGANALTGVLDVRDSDAWQTCLGALTTASGGTLDVLVNNAGILQSGEFVDIPLASQQRTIEVNVIGTLNGCYLAHPYLKRTPGAHVVNLASASAIYGQAELATYSASKFAVRGLTEALDLEWAQDDITVKALWPLFVATSMVEGMDTGATQTLGIHLTADDVADAVFKAASSGRGPFSGVHLPVGRQAKLLFATAQFSPSWILRQVNKRVTGH